MDMTQSLVSVEILLVQQKSLIGSCEGEYSHSLLSPFKERGQNLSVISYLESSNVAVSNCISMSEVRGKKENCFFF
jgi:hypothetical protein